MEKFSDSARFAEELLNKGKLIANGKSMAEAGVDAKWIERYATVAERVDRNRKYGLSRYPYEPGCAINALAGGFFDHKEWPIRKALEKHSSMRAVSEYEAKYINSTGYWLTFHDAAIELRTEEINAKDEAKAVEFDVWAIISVRYALRTLGLRTEFYKLAAEDPTYAKMILPALESKGEVPAADNLDKPLGDLDSHMTTQLMKAVATLRASNATKRAGGQGGPANGK